MWYAGDTSTDFNFYDQAGDAGGRLLIDPALWLNDRSPAARRPGASRPRIDDVMKIES